MARHKLTEKNLTTMTAHCSVDGLVGLRRAGKSVRCEVANKAAQKAWAQANPDKARENRQSKSDHHLFDRAGDRKTARCSICGPVDTIPWGRGVICGKRARELRTKQQSTPTNPCPDCKALDDIRVWTRTDGTCPRCEDTDMALSHLPAERRDPGFRVTRTLMVMGGYRYADDPKIRPEAYGTGFGIYTEDNPTLDEYESVVPGWKTIGSNEPWSEVA